jgi:hypothetical protein
MMWLPIQQNRKTRVVTPLRASKKVAKMILKIANKIMKEKFRLITACPSTDKPKIII